MAKIPLFFDQFVSFSEKKKMSKGNRALRRNSGKIVLPYLLYDNADPTCKNARINRQSSSKSEILEKSISETLIGILLINIDPINIKSLGLQYNTKLLYLIVDKVVSYYIKHHRFGGNNLAYQIKLVRWLLLSYVNIALIKGYYAMLKKAKKDHPDLFVHSNKAVYYYWENCPVEYKKIEDEMNINSPTYKAHECNIKRAQDIKQVIYDSMDAVRKRDLKDFVSSKNNGVSILFKDKVQAIIKKKGYGDVSVKTVDRGIRSYFEENHLTFHDFVEKVKGTCDKIKKVKHVFGKMSRVKIVGVKTYDKATGDEIVDDFGLVALTDDVWIPDNSTPFLDDCVVTGVLFNNLNY